MSESVSIVRSRYESLSRVCEANPERWGEPAIAAANAIADAESLAPDQWVHLLDRLDTAIASVKPPSPAISGVLRTPAAAVERSA